WQRPTRRSHAICGQFPAPTAVTCRRFVLIESCPSPRLTLRSLSRIGTPAKTRFLSSRFLSFQFTDQFGFRDRFPFCRAVLRAFRKSRELGNDNLVTTAAVPINSEFAVHVAAVRHSDLHAPVSSKTRAIKSMSS